MAEATTADNGVEREGRVIVRERPLGARIARIAALALLGLVALVALVVAFLDTGPGRRFVANQISGLEFENGLRIGVERIDGSIYGRMTIRGLTLYDPKGAFLRAPRVHVDWDAFKYLRNHVYVESLRAPQARLLRLPEFDETAAAEGPLLPDIDITVGEFRIGRLIVEPPVTGELRVGSVEGAAQIADGRAQVRLEGTIVGGDGRAGGDRVGLHLDAVPEENRLGLNLAVAAPANGLLAMLAGIDRPLTLRVKGSGDWQSWNGGLAANLGGEPIARLALAARDGTFLVDGSARPSRLVSGPAAQLLGPVTQVAIRSTWEERRAQLTARLSSNALRLAASGGISLADNSFNDLDVTFRLLRPEALAEGVSGRDVRGQLLLDGAFARPRVEYRLSAARLAFNDMSVVGLDARGSARFRDDHVAIPIDARAAAITGLDTVAGGAVRNVRIDGSFALDWPRLMADDLRIRSDRIDAEAVIVANFRTGLYTGALEGRIGQYRVESVGMFDLRVDADLRSTPGGPAIVGTVRARSTRLDNSGVRNLLGGNFTASTRFDYGPDGVVRFSRLRLDSPQLRVTQGSGIYEPGGRIRVTASGVSQQYGPVSVLVTGTTERPNVTLRATRPGFGLGLENLTAEIRSTAAGFEIVASGTTPYGPLDAEVTIATGAGPLTIDIRRAEIAGIELRGRVRQMPAGPFAGELTASGDGIKGLVTLSAAGEYQALNIFLRARDAVLPPPANISVGAAKVDARVILYHQPEVVADVQLADARLDSTYISAMRAVIDYRGGRGTAKALVEGRSGVPFRVALNAGLEPDLWRAALAGEISGTDFRTESPARIVPRDGQYLLLPTTVVLEDGRVQLAGRYGRGWQMLANLESVDLAMVNAFVPSLGAGGQATGAIEFTMSPGAFPEASIRLAVRDFTRTTAAAVSQPLDVNLVAELDADRASLRAAMRTRGTVIGRVQAIAEPLGAGIGWTERIARAPVRGGIRYLGPAESLFSFAGLEDQSLLGPLAVAADISCRVEDPCLRGIVRGKGLAYRNVSYGTNLTNMSLAGRFTGERLVIEQLTAEAGDGTVTGSGYVSLAASRGYPANFDLTLSQARVASSDDLRVTATGNLQLAKAPNEQAVLRGTIRLPSARYRIIREGAAEVPKLTGVRFKAPRGRAPAKQEPSPAAAFGDIALDLDVVAPNEVFVTGMGLESEWRADLHITGTASSPNMAGTVRLIRGTLSFAGHSFSLEEGVIRFFGGSDNARINLVAKDTIDAVEVTIDISGSVDDPQISFSSSPGLPQDEILALILFGNNIGSLSTMQAVQLAASLNTLRGSGGGFNPLGKLRAATGIDRLRILGAEEGRGTAIAAGKYITNDVYLEIVTDVRGYTATQLEVALTPSLSILSRAGGTSGTSVSVRYRKTY